MSKREWWNLLKSNWSSFYGFFQEYLPMSQKVDPDGEPVKVTVKDQIDAAMDKEDPVLARFLSETLWRMPDNDTTKAKPGYKVLITLVEEDPF